MATEQNWQLAALTAALMWVGPGIASGQAAASDAPSPEALLRRMSEYLKDATTLRFHGEINFDDVLVSGEKIQYAGAIDMAVKRPDRVYVDYRDDLSAKRFWYDGRTGTFLDLEQEKYSTVDLPDTIDAAVTLLRERYDLTLPMGELISSDLFAFLEKEAVAWGYIGIGDVEGTPAHHLALVGRQKDLQLWIQRDDPPRLLKFVITDKSSPTAPQYQAVLMDWKLGGRIAAETFRAALPKAAERIEFLVAEDGK